MDAQCQPLSSLLIYTKSDRSKTVTKYVLVAASGAFQMELYAVDRDSGALSFLSSASTGTNPQPVGFKDEYIYVPNNGSTNITILALRNDALIPIGTTTTNSNPTFASVAPGGAFLYVGNSGGLIERFLINSDGTLTSQGNFNTGGGGSLNLMKFTPDGSVAYLTDGGFNVLAQYAVGADGSLSLITTVATVANPSTFEPDGEYRFAYVPGSGGTDISIIDLRSGTAILSNTVPLGVAPITSRLSPGANNFLFTASNGANTLFTHRVDYASGNLTQISSTGGFNGLVTAQVDGSGQFVYITENVNNTLKTYSLDGQTGTLTLTSFVSMNNPAFFDIINETIEE